MANQTQIDKSSQMIANIIDKAKAELIADLHKLGNQIADKPAFATMLLDLDVEGTLKAKVKKATSLYANAHRQVLESTIQFASVEGESLVAFAALNEDLFNSAIINTIASSIRTQVSQGIQIGLAVDDLIQGVTNATISNAQMQTLINTTLNTYSRLITNLMMEEAPSDSKYSYVGPIDDRTRKECLEYAAAGEITLDEINSRNWTDSLSKGGGFNCRHKWEIAAEGEASEFNKQKEAIKRIKEQKKKDKNA